MVPIGLILPPGLPGHDLDLVPSTHSIDFLAEFGGDLIRVRLPTLLLGVPDFAARRAMIGEPAQRMVQDAFQMLDDLFDEHRRDRDVVDWTYLAGVGDLLLCKWCQELRRWAAAGVRWDPDRLSVEFAHWFGLPDPVPVMAVPLEDPWFDQNVGDILYQMLKRGKPAVDKWLKGMGSVEEVELEAEQGPQQPAAMPHSQQQEPAVSAFPQLGQAWAVGGVWYEVLPEEEGSQWRAACKSSDYAAGAVLHGSAVGCAQAE